MFRAGPAQSRTPHGRASFEPQCLELTGWMDEPLSSGSGWLSSSLPVRLPFYFMK